VIFFDALIGCIIILRLHRRSFRLKIYKESTGFPFIKA
jgi:hypothetical protein